MSEVSQFQANKFRKICLTFAQSWFCSIKIDFSFFATIQTIFEEVRNKCRNSKEETTERCTSSSFSMIRVPGNLNTFCDGITSFLYHLHICVNSKSLRTVISGSFKLDYDYEIEHEYDFRILSQERCRAIALHIGFR